MLKQGSIGDPAGLLISQKYHVHIAWDMIFSHNLLLLLLETQLLWL
jgi:hypothetical protein